MEDKKLGLSLKYKLLLLLTAIPVVSLSIYIGLATRLFENDKITYVKDSSVAVARSVAVQLRLEANNFLDRVRPIIESFDPGTQSFSTLAQESFARQDRLDALVLIQKSATGQYQRLGELKKQNQFADSFVANSAFTEGLRQQALKNGLALAEFQDSDLHIAMAMLIGSPDEVGHTVAVGLYRANDLYAAFLKSNIYLQFLIDKQGNKILGNENKMLSADVISAVLKSTLPEGAQDVGGEVPLIASHAETGFAGLKVVALVRKSDALAAVNVLLLQSLLFFVALIAVTVIVSVFASVKLTAALRDLYEATKLVAKGQFDVRVKGESNDEVGGLAHGFNFMAGEVSRLMLESKAKARMEGELETVKLVQDTLFPVASSQFGQFKIIGHIEAASECGGDWWNYNKIGDKLFLWIGDATGHGAPAAMVTSAAKSAASIIEDMPYITPGKALEILNKAIYETTKGKILMTFFVGAIDLKTGEMTYANASHEPPFLIRKTNGETKVTKKNLEPLVEAVGARLGDKRSSTYEEHKVQLNAGDALLFYTDGIVDLKNKMGKAWGERGFVRSICDSASSGQTADIRINKLKENISSYRENTELIDDITLFLCQYNEAA